MTRKGSQRTIFFTFDGAVLITAEKAHQVREILEAKDVKGKFRYSMKEVRGMNKTDKEKVAHKK